MLVLLSGLRTYFSDLMIRKPNDKITSKVLHNFSKKVHRLLLIFEHTLLLNLIRIFWNVMNCHRYVLRLSSHFVKTLEAVLSKFKHTKKLSNL